MIKMTSGKDTKRGEKIIPPTRPGRHDYVRKDEKRAPTPPKETESTGPKKIPPKE